MHAKLLWDVAKEYRKGPCTPAFCILRQKLYCSHDTTTLVTAKISWDENPAFEYNESHHIRDLGSKGIVSAVAFLLVADVHAIEEDLKQTEPKSPADHPQETCETQGFSTYGMYLEAEMQIQLSPFR